MSTDQISLYILAAIAFAGVYFLVWAFYRLCLETRRGKQRHNRSNIASYAQPDFEIGGHPQNSAKRRRP
jgi:hypothetical protein